MPWGKGKAVVEASALPWGADTCPRLSAAAGGSVPRRGGGMRCSASGWAEVAGALDRRGGTWQCPEELTPCESALNLEIPCSLASQLS